MKNTYWILALLVLFFVGDRCGGLVLKKLTEKSQFRYSRLYNGSARADILLLGNSRGLIFYQPYIESITGKETFNLSYNGMSMDIGRALIEDYLDRYPVPQQLIIDATMCDRENPGLLSGFNCYTPYSPRIMQLMKDQSPTSAYGGMLTHLYRYNSEVFQRAFFYLKKSDEDWLLDRVINDHQVENVEYEKGLDFTFANAGFDESYILAQLAATVEAAREKGVEVQLVVSPYYPPFFQKATGFLDWKQRVEKVTGLPVHDYSAALTDREAFGDYQHLNKKGSIQYLDLLKKDGILK